MGKRGSFGGLKGDGAVAWSDPAVTLVPTHTPTRPPSNSVSQKCKDCQYAINGIFLWNCGSWDVQGVHPSSFASDGSYYDPAVVSMIARHNAGVASRTGGAIGERVEEDDKPSTALAVAVEGSKQVGRLGTKPAAPTAASPVPTAVAAPTVAAVIQRAPSDVLPDPSFDLPHAPGLPSLQLAMQDAVLAAIDRLGLPGGGLRRRRAGDETV